MTKSSHTPKRAAKNPAPAAPTPEPAAPVLLNGVPYDPLAPGTNPFDPCDLFNPVVQAARLAAAPEQPSADPPDEPLPRHLDWHDPVDRAVWAREVYIQARDGLDAGDDATQPPAERELGRRTARRLITEALDKLEQLYRFADIDTAILLDPDAKPPKR